MTNFLPLESSSARTTTMPPPKRPPMKPGAPTKDGLLDPELRTTEVVTL